MQAHALWGMALATALSGCAEMSGGQVWPGRAWLAPPAPQDARPPDTLASGRQAARSIWGVVPSAPRRKADLRPGLIQGSAVAVSADTLVANCLVVGGRARVGLVRHNKYRIARVTADAHGQVCRLTVTEGPLTPVAGLRSFADLRVGEPVVALASRTSVEVAAAPGWLAGKGSAGDPFLEATPAVPAGNRSAVLVDGFGNLIGLGAAAPVAGGVVLAVPVGPAAAPSLARRDLGEADVLVAALAPTPRAQPRQAPVLLALADDDRDSADRTPATRRGDVAADEPEAAPTPRGSPVRGPDRGETDGPGATGGGGAGGAPATGGGNGNGATAGGGTGGEAPGAAPDVGGSQTPDAGPGTGAAPGDGSNGAAGGSTGGEAADDGGRGRGRGGSNRGRGGGRGDDGDDADGGTRGRGDDGGGRGHGRGGEDGGRGGGRGGDHGDDGNDD